MSDFLKNAVKILPVIENSENKLVIYTELDGMYDLNDILYIMVNNNGIVYSDEYYALDSYYNSGNTQSDIGYKLLEKNGNKLKLDIDYDVLTSGSFTGLTNTSPDCYIGRIYMKNLHISGGTINGAMLYNVDFKVLNSLNLTWKQGIVFSVSGNTISNINFNSKYSSNDLILKTDYYKYGLSDNEYTLNSYYTRNNYGIGLSVINLGSTKNLFKCNIYDGTFNSCNLSTTLKTYIYGGFLNDCNIGNLYVIDGANLYKCTMDSGITDVIEWVDGSWYSEWDGSVGNNPFNSAIWTNGTWNGGIFPTNSDWLNGRFMNGTFRGQKWMNGNFNNGTFTYSSTWYGGHFNNGTMLTNRWVDGTFNNGTMYGNVNQCNWENGTFNNGYMTGYTWEDGTFNNGNMLSCNWLNGTFNGGSMSGCNWIIGSFKGGLMINSVWSGGTFYNGTFQNSTWYNGKFYNGSIFSSYWHDGEMFFGIITTLDWSGGTWYNGIANILTFYGGDWYDGIFNNGTFYHGNWYDGSFNGGYFGKEVSTDRPIWYNGIFYFGEFNGMWLNGTFYHGSDTFYIVPSKDYIGRDFIPYNKLGLIIKPQIAPKYPKMKKF